MTKCPTCGNELKQVKGKVKLAVQLGEGKQDKLALAESIAREYHKGQKRFDGTDYITHLQGVVEILKKKGYSNEVLIVGWLHDILEDTKIGEKKLTELFGEEIFRLVNILTRGDENYLLYVLRCSSTQRTKTVKLADLEHNLSNLKKGSLRDKYILAKYVMEEIK